MIDTENLTKKFGDSIAVDSVTLHVGRGEVFGFLGPNGAGKTTTVRMLACLVSKSSGSATIGDYEIADRADQPKIRKMIGLLTENVGLYEELSAYDNLDFYGRYYKLGEQERKERIQYLLKLLELWDRKDSAAGTFSKGMKQKLAIARALVHDPEVLFLDEPTANLDPEASKTVRDFILELKKEKRTIFLNTHLLDEAERVCDRVAILKTRLITTGSPQDLRRSLTARKVKIQLQRLDGAVISSVKEMGYQVGEATANSIVVTLKDPEVDNPAILRAVQKAGGNVVFVSEVGSSLEDVYLKLVRED
ncbi:MAG: ABC transporter ATP-binding protein [Nitrososphaerota archaeon]|jgi:ABC-2 type transport system ATP-binding protein|nr:ABC transporter ATP-binding protein [Nitrososphaerota archaeon]MDG7015370.1 ABC transporter ATP-binding protein [Nitrososphaerota archaeon]WGO51085.1 MAG: ABC transporter ATP-binding protein [Nitrososphaerota archaeon]